VKKGGGERKHAEGGFFTHNHTVRSNIKDSKKKKGGKQGLVCLKKEKENKRSKSGGERGGESSVEKLSRKGEAGGKEGVLREGGG